MSSKATRLVHTPKAMKELATKILTTDISRIQRVFDTFVKVMPARDLDFFTKKDSPLDIVVYTLSKMHSAIVPISSDVTCKY